MIDKGQKLHRRLTKEGKILQDHRYRLRVYPKSFTGCDFVQWLIEIEEAADGSEAMRLGQGLLENGVIHHGVCMLVSVYLSHLYIVCILSVYCLYIVSILSIYCLYIVCIFSVMSLLYIVCILPVYYLYIICILSIIIVGVCVFISSVYCSVCNHCLYIVCIIILSS